MNLSTITYIGYGTLGDGVSCGSWTIFKNSNMLKVFMVLNISKELTNDSIITKLNVTTNYNQFSNISSNNLPNAGIVSFNTNGELKTVFRLSEGEYRIDSIFILHI